MTETVLAVDAYDLTVPLGQGAMGQVWEAIHRTSGTPVAMKMLTRVYAKRPEFQKRFLREIEASARLDHPNIVRVIDYGTLPNEARTVKGLSADCPYFVMEKAEGPVQRKNLQDIDSIIEALHAVLRGLSHSHAHGVVHRDIKPDNIMRFENGRIALADFGISHGMERQTATEASDYTARNTEEATGTPRYMSPEQILGHWRDYGPWTDVYSVGILAYLMVCGKAPFSGQNLFDVANKHLNHKFPALKPFLDVPDGLEEWIQRMTQKDWRDRYQTAIEAADALVELAGHTPTRVTELPALPYGLGMFGIRRLPAIGREREKNALNAAAEAAEAGETKVVIIRADRGLGSSRMANWIGEKWRERTNVATYQTESSSDALSWLLSQRFRTIGLGPDACQQRIEHLLGEMPEEQLEGLAGLVSQTSSKPDERISLALTPNQRRELVRTVIQLDGRHAATCVLMHDANPDTIGLVQAVLDNPPGHCLVVLTANERLDLEDHPDVEVLKLNPLSPTEMAELVRNQLGIPPKIASQVESLAAGYPLFALELVEQWRNEGSLTLTDTGKHQLVTDLVPAELSKIFEGRMLSFIMRSASKTAPELSVLALRICAALGEQWDPAEFEAAWELTGNRPIENFEEHLVKAAIARPVGTWLRWQHPLMRATVQDEAKEKGGWAEANGFVSRMLATRYSSGHPMLARRMAKHLLDGGNPMAAQLAIFEALEKARERLDSAEYGELGEMLDRALDVQGKGPRNSARALALAHQAVPLVTSARLDNVERGRKMFDNAVAIAEKRRTADHRAVVFALAGWATVHKGDRERGRELLQKAASEPGISIGTRCFALMFATSLASHERRWDDMVEMGNEVLRNCDVPAWKLRVQETLIHYALTRKDLKEATDRIDVALKLAEATGQPHLRAHLHNLMGFAADASGEYEAAEREHRKAKSLAEIFSPGSGSVFSAQEYMARALLQQGKLVDARIELEEIAARFESGAGAKSTHPWDAQLAVAAGLSDFEAYDSLLEDATNFGDLRPNTLHARALTRALSYLETNGATQRAAELRKRVIALLEPHEDLQGYLPS